MECTDIYEDLYIFKHYGKDMKDIQSWTPRPCSNIIPGCPSIFYQKLDNTFGINPTINDFTSRAVH